jgi:hypothetical protein
MMQAYRKKPIVILAERWFKDGDVEVAKIKKCQEPGKCKECQKPLSIHGLCPTLEGWHIVCPGDWIVRGIKGEYYPVKPDIFEKTYEPVNPT